MPTLFIENVPASLFDRIQRLAKARQLTPADIVLEVLEAAFRSEPFLTEEICEPFYIPSPKGEPVHAVRVPAPLPTPHDLPDEE